MQKPIWVKVVGTLLIIMGVFGILGGLSTFATPQMLAMQKKMMPEIKKAMEEQSKTSGAQTEQVMAMYEKMGDVPPWFSAWCMISGTIALILSGLLIFTAIGLFKLKQSSLKMFYWVMGLDVVFLIVRAFVTMTALTWLGMSTMVGAFFSVAVNVILVAVVVNCDQQAFSPEIT